MTYPELNIQNLPVRPVSEASAALPCIQNTGLRVDAVPAASPDSTRPGKRTAWTRLGYRVAAAYTASCLVLAGEQTAEASPVDITAQVEAPASGSTIFLWITGATAIAGALTGAVALGKQTREKKHDRFIDALRDVAGTSDAAQIQARLNILSIYAKDKQHKPDVFTTAVQYLRARRSAIIELRESLEGVNPNERLVLLDRGLAKRRNADREMLALLTETRQAALVEHKARQGTMGHLGRFMGWAQKNGEQAKLQTLRTVTGLRPTGNTRLVNAAGINLDLMRDTVADRDLSELDLTGAGLQGNNFENVVFADCDFGEAQLEGTTMMGCDLSGADFRAAYFSGDASNPYYMGSSVVENCIVDETTQFGHRPDNHPKARHRSNSPGQPRAYRGGGTVILRNLRSRQLADGTPALSDTDIVALVQKWRANGLEVDLASDPQYL